MSTLLRIFIVCVIGLMSVFSQNVSADIVLPGSGSYSDPYQISTAEQLISLQDFSSDTFYCYALVNDIDLSGYVFDRAVIAAVKYEYENNQFLGYTGNAFLGDFNGNGHTISNITVLSTSAYGESYEMAGLFGEIALDSFVYDIGLGNINIQAHNLVGGICGRNNGIILGCRVDGYIAGRQWVGGICGYNTNCLYYCYSLATLASNMESPRYWGGISGFNNAGFIYECYSASQFEINHGGEFAIGGVVGGKAGSTEEVRCLWDQDVSGISNSSGGTGLTTEEMYELSTYVDADWSFAENSSFVEWKYVDGWYPLLLWEVNGYVDFPDLSGEMLVDAVSQLSYLGFDRIDTGYVFSDVPEGQVVSQSVDAGETYYCHQEVSLIISIGQSQTGVTGTGTEGDPYVVSTPEQLFELASIQDFYPLYTSLGDDIDLSGYTLDGPVFRGEFSGVFDGAGYVIKGLTIDSDGSGLALFASIAEGGIVKGLGLENIDISGDLHIAGLCADNYGRISQCYVSGAVYGNRAVGGICAVNNGIVMQCYSDIDLTGYMYVGGLCGGNLGTVYDSYCFGAVLGVGMVGGLVGTNVDTSSVISNSYVSSEVIGGTVNCGALCGYGYDDVIIDCYWNKTVSGIQSSVGGTAISDIGLRRSPVGSWDYSDTAGSPAIWQRIAGYYPVLAWQQLDTVIMPDITGMQLGDAISLLNDAGFEDIYCRKYYRNAEPGSVLSQSVEAGSAGFVKSTIYLEVCLDNKFPGEGTEVDPFIIDNADGLMALGAATGQYGGYYVLASDIDLSDYYLANSIFAAGSATDGGFDGVGFTGTFDGGGHIITGLKLETYGLSYVGLFGYLGEGSQVRDLVIEGCEVYGDEKVGGLAGQSYGTIENCHVSGKVEGTYLTGGLCGGNFDSGNILLCSADTVVNGDEGAGGLCGGSSGTISESYCISEVTGDIKVGGFCGIAGGTVEKCYSKGLVYGSAGVGGLCGYANDQAIFTESFSVCSVAGTDYTGGLVGYITYETEITGCLWDSSSSVEIIEEFNQDPLYNLLDKVYSYSTEFMQDERLLSLLGWGESWTLPAGDYPHLSWENAGGSQIAAGASYPGRGTAEDPWLLSCAVDLLVLSRNIELLDDHFILTDDIDMQGHVFCETILGDINDSVIDSCFQGVFNGDGHIISNFVIESDPLIAYEEPSHPYYNAVFEVIGPEGIVRNLGIESIHLYGTADYSGAFCGLNAGLIENCYVTGIINASETGAGFCYDNNAQGEIRSCYSDADVYVDVDSYDDGLFQFPVDRILLSGFCQENNGVIESSYYSGRLGPVSLFYESTSANDTLVMQCFDGFCSDNSGTITDCFWDAEKTVISDSDGGTGLTTDQMQSMPGFAQWIGSDSWVMPEGDYPRLSWEGIAGVSFAGSDIEGSGTEADPYQIATALDLLTLANDTETYGFYMQLKADIDLSGYEFERAVFAPYVLDGENYYDVAFYGVFDGAGHTISNLTVEGKYDEGYDGGSRCLGLFGVLGGSDHAVVRDLFLKDVSVSGYDYVGGLCGYNNALVERCYVTGSVSGYSRVGGLCGYNECQISQSFANCFVKGSSLSGGFCGYNDGVISDCFNRGTVFIASDSVGGFCGYNRGGTVEYSYSACRFTDDSYAYGGFCGASYNGSIVESYWDTDVSGVVNSVGGIGLTTAEMQDINTYSGYNWSMSDDLAGDSTWLIDGGYPLLRYSAVDSLIVTGQKVDTAVGSLADSGFDGVVSTYVTDAADYGTVIAQVPNGSVCSPVESFSLTVSAGTPVVEGNGSDTAPYEVSSVADFMYIMQDTSKYDSYFVLTADLDFSGLSFDRALVASYSFDGENYEGVDFSGVFNGDGHVISNLEIDAVDEYSNFVGLFGYVSDGALIYNLGLENVKITGEVNVGSLAGRCDGNVYRCYASGTVTGKSVTGGLLGLAKGMITESYCDINVSGLLSVGGLCGYTVSDITDSYVLGSVEGADRVGGICGYCYSSGMGILNCYSAAKVRGGYMLNDDYTQEGACVIDGYGLAYGLSSYGNFSYSIFNCDLTSAIQADTGDGVRTVSGGVATSGMMDIQTYENMGWDITTGSDGESIWQMVDGSYPKLSWQDYETDMMVQVSVTGLTLIDAVYSLESAGYTVGEISYDVSYSLPFGHVLHQEFLGTWQREIAANATIDLVVSLGGVSFDGEGTELSPYLIKTAEELVAFGLNSDMYGSYVRLINNIDLSGLSFNNALIAPNTSLTGNEYNGVSFSGVV